MRAPLRHARRLSPRQLLLRYFSGFIFMRCHFACHVMSLLHHDARLPSMRAMLLFRVRYVAPRMLTEDKIV